MALQTHPDRLPQNVTPEEKKAAEEQFRLVNNAYEVLNDTENRKVSTRPFVSALLILTVHTFSSMTSTESGLHQ